MPRRLDLHGMTFGRLTVIESAGKDPHGAVMWRCQCACGTTRLVRGATLNRPNGTRACQSCAVSTSNTTHGQTGTALYMRWRAMLNRCESPSHRGYKNYGGRGIEVCVDWHSFDAFAADMGATFNPALELDRRDADGHYERSNCRWVTRTQQQRNRRNNHVVEYGGRRQTIVAWGDQLGIKPNTILTRLRRGWPVEQALLELANQ